MNKYINFLISIGKGILIRAGAILPGISSGVLCVIFGIYEKLVNSILGFFTNIKENIKFLFPIILGTSIGFVLFGNILNYFFKIYETECKLLFLGLILGSIPILFKQVNQKKKFRLSFLFYTLISFLFSLLLLTLENKINTYCAITQNNFILLFLSGFAMSAGIIIPGISSTAILMCFGTYYIYLEAISILEISILIPMGLGVICGGICFLFLIRFLLNNYFFQTFYAIIGFVLCSTIILLPDNFSFISIILFILGLFISINFSNKKEN